jgi:hypothetical protein
MDHLTNFYKHKCEQLQEQINNMKRMLNESDANPAPQNEPGYEQPFKTPDGHWQSPSPQSPTQPTQKPTSNPGGPPPQPTGNDPEEWFRWLDEMWYFWLNFLVNNGDPTQVQLWWETWQGLQNLAPNGIGDQWDRSRPNKGWHLPIRRIPRIPNPWPNHGIDDTTIPFPIDPYPHFGTSPADSNYPI